MRGANWAESSAGVDDTLAMSQVAANTGAWFDLIKFALHNVSALGWVIDTKHGVFQGKYTCRHQACSSFVCMASLQPGRPLVEAEHTM